MSDAEPPPAAAVAVGGAAVDAEQPAGATSSEDVLLGICYLLDERKMRGIDLFRVFDSTPDGHVTPDEFKAVLVEMDFTQSEDVLQSVITALDPDRSGTMILKEMDRSLRKAEKKAKAEGRSLEESARKCGFQIRATKDPAVAKSEQPQASEEAVPMEDTKALIRLLKQTPAQDKVSLLNDFFVWLEPRWYEGWTAAFRPDNTMPWADFKEFVKNGGSHGQQYQLGRWTGDPARVFKYLCEDGCDYICKNRCMQARRKAETQRDVCEWGLSGLRKLLTQKFGSLSHAWRNALDPESSGRCSKVNFMRKVRTYGFHGSLKTCWSDLSGAEHNRVVRLSHLDPEIDALMLEFAQALVAKFGGLKEGWSEVMSHPRGQRLDLPRFTDVVESLGMSRRDGKRIFQCFDSRDFGHLAEAYSEDNLTFLKIWDPAIPANAADNGSVGSPSLSGFSSPGRSTPSPSKQKFGIADESSVMGIDAPSLAFEFQVVLTKEEYNEYLRRRRHLRGQVAESHGVRQSAKSCLFHQSVATSPALSASVPPSPGQTSFGGASPGQTSFGGGSPGQTSFPGSPRGAAATPMALTPRGGTSPRSITPRADLGSSMASPRQTPQASPRWSSPRGYDPDRPPKAHHSLSHFLHHTIPE